MLYMGIRVIVVLMSGAIGGALMDQLVPEIGPIISFIIGFFGVQYALTGKI